MRDHGILGAAVAGEGTGEGGNSGVYQRMIREKLQTPVATEYDIMIFILFYASSN